MSLDRRAVIAGALAFVGLPPAAQAQSLELQADGLKGEHPVSYYKLASDLFKAGRKDDAVFIFYLGQLRFRTHLAARPNLPPDRDPVLFAALSERLGPPINEYAFGDINALVKIVDRVLAYDKQNPDSFTSPTEFPAAHAQTRRGLVKFRKQILADAPALRKKRLENGLENRRAAD